MIGHVACVPQRWRRGDTTAEILCIVNAVTEPGRGRALFAGLVLRALRGAAGATPTGYGVTNEASSIPTLHRLRCRLVCSLPVEVAVPALPIGVRTLEVTETTLRSDVLGDVLADLAPRRPPAWTQEWTPETLRWRLAAPGAHYAVHWSDDLVAVSARTRVRGIRIGALMKLLPRPGPVSPAATQRAVGAVHRHHRVPVVVYAGFNRLAPVSGVSVPPRWRPGPLNLFAMGDDIAAELVGTPDLRGRGVPSSELEFDAFELLDFDPL